MVNPSLETPTVYAAVNLDAAFDIALKKSESELREMEQKKQELHETSKQQQFRSSDKFTKFRMFKSVKEGVANMISGLNALEKELLFVLPGPWVVMNSQFGVIETAKKVIGRGVDVRGICDVTYSITEPVQEHLDTSEDVRHFSQYWGIYFRVMDRKYCVSVINADIKRTSLDEPLSAFATDDTTYVNDFVSTFEMLWEQSVPQHNGLKSC